MKQLLLLLVLAAGVSAAVPPAEKLLPADTLAFLTVPDWSKAGTNFASSAVGQFWGDPAMKAFKDKFLEKFNTDTIKPLEKELGFKFSDYLALAEGQFTIAVTQNGWDGKSAQQPGVIWIIDTGEKSLQLKTNLAGLRQKWTESARKMRTDKIRDIEFTTVIVESEGLGKSLQKMVPGPKAPSAPADPAAPKRTIEWLIGQSGPLLIVSDAARDVEKVLALQSGASVPVLADQAAFAANAPMLREAQTFLWINMKPIMSTLAKRPAPKAEPDNLMGGGFSVEKILTAIGLGSVQTLAGNFTQNRDGSLMNFALTVPENARRGLVRILALSPKDASPPPFVPADAVKFSRWRIDLQKGWSTVETMLTEISPAYAGFSKLILDTAGKDKDPNFDFRKQLLGNFGDDLITYQKAPRTQTAEDLDSPPAVTLVGAKNAEQLAASLKAVASIFPPNLVKYSEREFLGRKVYSFTMPNAGGANAKPLSYAASGGYVAFSSDPAALEEYLRSGEGVGRPLRELAGLNAALPRVGGTGNGYFSFENQKETMRASFETAKKDPKVLASLLGGGQLGSLLGGDGKGMADWFDPSLLPPFDSIAKYFYIKVGGLEVAPDAITFKVFSPLPPELRK